MVGKVISPRPRRAYSPLMATTRRGHHEFQHSHIREAEHVHDLVVFGQAGLVQRKAEEDAKNKGKYEVCHVSLLALNNSCDR